MYDSKMKHLATCMLVITLQLTGACRLHYQAQRAWPRDADGSSDNQELPQKNLYRLIPLCTMCL
jgi:hypothetical protein